ncbi:hypothetical protein [Exiguobacterium sp. RIT341]|uniref:hypothetical protein n=1 Tax=Exiguobacterium sp. RIT341 TaxID=1470592 RepID=UPI00044ABD57|nr:hypothetical protein [Exiguobacterium sp. RIT341]EZP58430.1 hypothetical protein BW42_03112 [Exiguobacterium sp. RIT341]
MNRNELSLIQDEQLSIDEKQEINTMIEQTIYQYKDNSAQIAKYTIDSVTALAIADSQTDELENQSFLKRTFRNLTGGNRALERNISYNQRRAQHAAQYTLSKLADQNLLTFDLLTAVNSKLNAYMVSNTIEINELYSMLFKFVKETRGNFLKSEQRFDYLDQRVELLKWAQTAEYATFDGDFYSELDIASKVVCLTTDFYTVSKGEWDTTDLLLIKSVLKDLGENPSQEISSSLILNKLIEDTSLRGMMGEIVNFDRLSGFSPLEIPILHGLHKATNLLTDEKYLVRTILDNLDASGVEKNEVELTRELSLNYISELGLRDLRIEQPIFEIINELLMEMKILNDYVGPSDELMLLDSNTSEEKHVKEYEEELYEVIILDYEMDKFELTMLLTRLLEIDVTVANDLLNSDNLMHRIVSDIPYEEAQEINQILLSHQVSSVVNLRTDPLLIVSLEIMKIKEALLKYKSYPFNFSEHIKYGFDNIDLKTQPSLTPYSIISGLQTSAYGGFASTSTLEVFVANVNGMVLKVFQDINELTIEKRHESEQKIPLFCIKRTEKRLGSSYRNRFYARPIMEQHSIGLIHINELCIDSF